MNKGLLCALLIAAMAISSSAADPAVAQKPAATASANKVKRYPFHANVAGVDAAKQTITLDGKKKQRVLQVTPATRIQKDKKPVALASITTGEYITGSLKDTDGLLEAVTVNVGGLTPKQDKQPAQPSSGVKNTFAVRPQTPTTKVSKPPATKP